MKKSIITLAVLLSFIKPGFSQTSNDEVISFGTGSYNHFVLQKPIVRIVEGGTIIKVIYSGQEWEKNLERKNAFEHACRILEEALPTTTPILVKVAFGSIRGTNAIVKTIIDTDTDIYDNNQTRTTTKRRIFTYDDAEINDVNYFDQVDGEITFSNQDIFSYSLDHVISDKYDFITVALRELGKICGIYFSPIANNSLRLLAVNPTSLTRYDKLVLPYEYWNNQSAAYAYATSGNVYAGVFRDEYKYYSPSVFENNASLSYFAKDESNLETRLFQPDLPKGTSIRYVGSGPKDIWEEIGWDYPIVVGIGGGGSGGAGGTITNEVKSYTGSHSFGGNRRNSTFTYSKNNSIKKQNNIIKRSSMNHDLGSYLGQFSNYPYLNTSPYIDPYFGWSISILKKDGTWDLIAKEVYFEQGIDFTENMVDPSKVKDYARSSDGYLRCRGSYCFRGPSLGGSLGGDESYSSYFLWDWKPQIPEMALSKVMPSTRSSYDDYYADVKIAFKNIEGTDRILVEQQEEGTPIPFVYYVDNINDGYFIATVDKDFSTSFTLKAINANGVTISEEFILAPINNRTYSIHSSIEGNNLKITFIDNRGNICEDKNIANFQLLNITNQSVNIGILSENNTIDISSLENGIYGIKITDEKANTYNTKFIK